MIQPAKAYLRWAEEEDEAAQPTEDSRLAHVAWLVCDITDDMGVTAQRFLAYLGRNPAVTPALMEEVVALYPEVEFDWEALRQAVERGDSGTDVSSLTDDELAQRLRQLAREHGLSLSDLSLRLGSSQRDMVTELLRFLEDRATVARFERTSGSIFDYLVERHLDYAFLLYKARLFFSGQDAHLTGVIGAEPTGFGAAAWRARRLFWREQLDAYLESRRAIPDGAADEDV
ncbi:MAG: hypothetical protein M3442_17250 [Chloroflexota bacterium]|nr:hypothetical protein [Chloroflexota bacterium]